MLNVYARAPDGRVFKSEAAQDTIAKDGAVWIDLFEPTEAEEAIVEQAYGVDAPTKLERTALEDSARFYEENGALTLTATVVASRRDGSYVSDGVSFVLVNDRLITVRAIDSRAFQIGAGRASARIQNAEDGQHVFLALLEGVIERVADILHECADKAQVVSRNVFAVNEQGPDLHLVLDELGRLGATVNLCHDSLTSIERLAAFTQHVCGNHKLSGDRLGAFSRDADQLERTADTLQNHLTFLLDATLGLVAVAQNRSLQRLSVAAMIFVPSTLLAGIFGMNFKAMTIFDAPWGPWAGFGLMIAATLAALALARYRRWI